MRSIYLQALAMKTLHMRAVHTSAVVRGRGGRRRERCRGGARRDRGTTRRGVRRGGRGTK